MTTLEVAAATNPTAAALVGGLLSADAAAIAACFADGARLRALTPPGLREREGSAEIGELMASWFSDCTELALIDVAVSEVVDRQHISYRIAATKEGRGACIIEQQLYVEATADRLTDVSLVCSGFRPVE
jgi:hypothetical protein